MAQPDPRTLPVLPSREKFKELLPTHPGVTQLQRPKPCDGFMASKFSFKRQRNGTVPACQVPARWSFEHLRSHHHWIRDGRTPKPPVVHYCWQHLMHRGVWGSMEEESRTHRWLNRLGYTTLYQLRLLGYEIETRIQEEADQ